ncbi:mucin-5AC [Sorghum bicolor]|uniref:mucin-5AC n=1 Tax=Sorghum bicolor TaxID=4558 RepID=UPI000B4247EE|nr:mucin-5AC [Sorghum bicolor]|eukprot:XP_021306925.1 mucin-5AC [Sorghum bicolor]
MASSSSNSSSTSSSSTPSTPSAARVPSDSERVRPRLPTSAPAASAALGVVPGAAIASASAPGVSRSIKRPPTTYTPTAWGGSKGVPQPSYFARDHQRGRGGRSRNSMGVSQHVSRKPSQKSGWQSAADPTSTFAPSRLSIEGSSSSPSAWSKPLPRLSTVASTPTDTRPASAASSSTTLTPSPDITLVPNAPGSAPVVATSADTAPEPDASTSSAPGGTTIADLALEPDALNSASCSLPGVAMTVDAALEPDASTASTPSSAPGVTTIADPSATTSAPGAAPIIPSLRDNWVALHWGIVPRSVELEPCPGQQALGGNGMPPVEALYPDPLCPWREQVPPRSFGVLLCWECRNRPARVHARPCDHLAICVRCYCYFNSNRFVCPYCAMPITWLL